MELLIAAGVGLVVFSALFFAVYSILPDKGEKRTKTIIDQITNESGGEELQDADSIAASFKDEATGVAKFLLSLPGAEEFYARLLKAGHSSRVKHVILVMILLFVGLSIILFAPLKLAAIPVAAVLTYFIPKKFFEREIKKRNQKFLDQFPEAIDMIVRSVKSGHPLNTALRMISDNIADPIGGEFRQLVSEIAYGRPLVDALRRLAKRVDEQDVHFFVVVLAVQQETGGNLAEILKNLSSVIRGRKRLKQKIQAMTSEGKATLAILGGLPFFVYGAIHFSSPEYLHPLYFTFMGNIILASALGLILLAVFVISRMIDVDI